MEKENFSKMEIKKLYNLIKQDHEHRYYIEQYDKELENITNIEDRENIYDSIKSVEQSAKVINDEIKSKLSKFSNDLNLFLVKISHLFENYNDDKEGTRNNLYKEFELIMNNNIIDEEIFYDILIDNCDSLSLDDIDALTAYEKTVNLSKYFIQGANKVINDKLDNLKDIEDDLTLLQIANSLKDDSPLLDLFENVYNVATKINCKMIANGDILSNTMYSKFVENEFNLNKKHLKYDITKHLLEKKPQIETNLVNMEIFYEVLSNEFKSSKSSGENKELAEKIKYGIKNKFISSDLLYSCLIKENKKMNDKFNGMYKSNEYEVFLNNFRNKIAISDKMLIESIKSFIVKNDNIDNIDSFIKEHVVEMPKLNIIRDDINSTTSLLYTTDKEMKHLINKFNDVKKQINKIIDENKDKVLVSYGKETNKEYFKDTSLRMNEVYENIIPKLEDFYPEYNKTLKEDDIKNIVEINARVYENTISNVDIDYLTGLLINYVKQDIEELSLCKAKSIKQNIKKPKY